MIGSFRGAYMMAFSINGEVLSMACYTSYHMLNLLLLIASASITNEAKDKTKRIINSLPYRIPALCKQIRCMIKGNYEQDNSLTLWNFCVLNRSTLTTSVGTLLTYGILLGTLGK
ncbi:hypothetical protein AVEN_202564-1 [Araneus ventricosus]|uniref:Gustatory receptor n=1 Tax=Araneus ventricosus TaxID=182803 RepID=A0A4Y2JV01_ARAVE|nr:hypothetical protein AVEN_202564-1 [Araneus ventricosus]